MDSLDNLVASRGWRLTGLRIGRQKVKPKLRYLGRYNFATSGSEWYMWEDQARKSWGCQTWRFWMLEAPSNLEVAKADKAYATS